MGTILAIAVRDALAWEVLHGRTVGSRRTVGGHRASAASAQGPTRQARAAARGRPRLSDRHRLRLPQRYPLGDASPGDGLRLRGHVFPPAAAVPTPVRVEKLPAY